MGDRLPVFRITQYELLADQFTGLTYTLALNNFLAPDYFVVLNTSTDGLLAGEEAPENWSCAVTSDPFGTGDLANTGKGSLIFTRESQDRPIVGTITVVECIREQGTKGFRLRDVRVTNLPTPAPASGPDVTVVTANTAWSDVGQVSLHHGGSVTTGATVDRHTATVMARLEPSGDDQITIERREFNLNVVEADLAIYVVEWGSEWTVQTVTTPYSATVGDGSLLAHYDTGVIPIAVERAETMIFSTVVCEQPGTTGATSVIVTLGDGINELETEGTIAINVNAPGTELTRTTTYLMSHPDLAVSWHRHPFGDGATVDHLYVVPTPTVPERRFTTVTVPNIQGERLALLWANNELAVAPSRNQMPAPLWWPFLQTNDRLRAERFLPTTLVASIDWNGAAMLADFAGLVRVIESAGALDQPLDEDPISSIPVAFEPEHCDRILEALLFQFRDKPRITALACALAEGVQQLEDVVWTLIADRTLQAASGASLDQWGGVVGEDRGALDDDDYRRFIQARIIANNSGGTTEELIRVFVLVTAPSTVEHVELLPMTAIFRAFREVPMSIELRGRVRRIMDAARGTGRELELIEVPTNFFGFAGNPDALGYDQGIFSRNI